MDPGTLGGLMPRLVTLMPHAQHGESDLDLARAYNEDMRDCVPDGAWAILLDHDMAWTTKRWFRQIQEAIAFKPEAGAFAVVTNRIAAPWQQVGDQHNHDMLHHFQVGEQRAAAHRSLLDITDTKGFGGVVTIVSKAVWRQVGGYTEPGFFCVDHSLFFKIRAAGLRVYLLENCYVYHRRRAGAGGGVPRTAPITKGCPCRGPERMPTVRIPLPQPVCA